MRLTNSDLADLTGWRRDLHRHPELSGQEAATAARVQAFLAATGPDDMVTGLGGHGVAVVFDGAAPGPTVLIRCELDALPIEELGTPAHRSQVAGLGHMCGHDGHMAIVAAVGRLLGRERPARGRAVLLFQPAEETGAGSAAMLSDPRFAALLGGGGPETWAFALHNMPGLPLGRAMLKPGPANCASQGLRIGLSGRTSHASAPEAGISPAGALAALLPALAALGTGGPVTEGFRLVTITHARMGEPAFGISPGAAELWLTLRTLSDADMADLQAQAAALARHQAGLHGLHLTLSTHDSFAACTNHPEATALLDAALRAEGLPPGEDGLPMRASEDFGRFSQVAKTAMFLLGAGERQPMLHNPDYDFPDDLIEPGARVFRRLLRDLLG